MLTIDVDNSVVGLNDSCYLRDRQDSQLHAECLPISYPLSQSLRAKIGMWLSIRRTCLHDWIIRVTALTQTIISFPLTANPLLFVYELEWRIRRRNSDITWLSGTEVSWNQHRSPTCSRAAQHTAGGGIRGCLLSRNSLRSFLESSLKNRSGCIWQSMSRIEIIAVSLFQAPPVNLRISTEWLRNAWPVEACSDFSENLHRACPQMEGMSSWRAFLYHEPTGLKLPIWKAKVE